MKDDTWTRLCSIKRCFSLAGGDSDYCKKHRKERKAQGLEIKRSKPRKENL